MSYIKEELESMLIEHPKNEAKLTEIDFSRHDPVYDFSKSEELDDDYDYLPTQEEADLLKQLSDEEIKKIDDLINKNVVKVKKIK